ncbi:MAG TPA: hypothetical protein PK867_01590, partial [Pirellulales bacterium]|nr:hypothetical protein [Pirellulales bacterium]
DTTSIGSRRGMKRRNRMHVAAQTAPVNNGAARRISKTISSLFALMAGPGGHQFRNAPLMRKGFSISSASEIE